MIAEGEPYSGVQALFNADLHKACPKWAPREDWTVLFPTEIIYTPVRVEMPTEVESGKI